MGSRSDKVMLSGLNENSIWKIFLLSLMVLPLSGMLTFIPPWQMYATDRYRLLGVAVLLAVAMLHIFISFIRRRDCCQPVILYVFGLFVFSVFGGVSAWLALFPRYALLEWAYFIGCGLLGLGVYQAVQIRGSNGLRDLILAVFFSAYMYTIFYVVWYFAVVDCRELFCVQLRLPGLDNPRTFDTFYLPFLFLYPLANHYLSTGRLVKWTYWGLGAVWFSLLYVSNSRTNYLAIMLVCPLMYVLSPGLALPWLRRFAFFLILGAVGYGVMHGLWPLLGGASLEVASSSSVFATGSVHSRLELWRRGLNIFLEYPLLGAGPMHFAYYGDIPHIGEGANPHNLIIQLLSEWGIVCTFLFAAGVLWLFFRAVVYFRQYTVQLDSPAGTQKLILFAAWVAMLLATQTSGTNLPILMGLGGVLAGLVLQENTRSGQSSCYSYIVRSGIALFSIAVIGLLINGLYPEVACRREEASAYLKAYPDDKIPSPRFWSQGKIAFSDRYLAQCYEDAERLFVEKGWRSRSTPEKSP